MRLGFLEVSDMLLELMSLLAVFFRHNGPEWTWFLDFCSSTHHVQLLGAAIAHNRPFRFVVVNRRLCDQRRQLRQLSS